MLGKDFRINAIVFLLGLTLLSLVVYIFPMIEKAQYMFDIKNYYILTISMYFLFVLFGILIEWKSILKIFTQGISVNAYLLFLGVILLVYILIPSGVWMPLFGMNTFILKLGIPHIRTAMSILLGITIVRAFIKKD